MSDNLDNLENYKIIEGYDCLAEIRAIRERKAEEYYRDPEAYYERIRTAPMRYFERVIREITQEDDVALKGEVGQ